MKALVALDGSDHALRAIEWVARSEFAHATALTVASPPEVPRRRRGCSFDRPEYALPGELAGVSARSVGEQVLKDAPVSVPLVRSEAGG
jgi:hypothetical protein